jgi:metal-sulfur cluster biosynthetic enzyme
MRSDEVQSQLARVYDPELDQPLTELGFVGGVTIDGGVVTVGFRLPTFWCAANFAFMMAADIRERVSELPWVERVDVRLQDHFCAEEINSGINGGKNFVATFPSLATDDLDELRETFRVKAFLARQERLLRALRGLGWTDDAILKVRIGDLPDLPLGSEDAALASRYLAILTERGLAGDLATPAFVYPDGKPIDGPGLSAHLARAQRTRLSVEFNASFCRALLKTRYGEADSLPEDVTVERGDDRFQTRHQRSRTRQQEVVE